MLRRTYIEDAAPKGRPERSGELECVHLGDVSRVSIHDRVADDHRALVLVAEPASRLQKAEPSNLREFLDIVVEGITRVCCGRCTSLHRRVPGKETVDRLLPDSVIVSNDDHVLGEPL